MKKSVVVTGANGYLGRHIIDYFSNDPELFVTALVSPSYNDSNPLHSQNNIQIIKADLTKKLNSNICRALKYADKIFHFAWSRLNDIEKETKNNIQIIEKLLNEISNKGNFFFISSVAASPNAISSYGKIKYQISQMLYELGCCVLVCGLVIEPNPLKGPYKLLKNLISKSPISIRFINGVPVVYPIMIDDIGFTLQSFIGKKTYKKTYRLFTEQINLNNFLVLIENTCKPKRISINLDVTNVLRIVNYMNRAYLLPNKIYEKISTFLYKDTDYLLSLDDFHDINFRHIKID